MFEAVLCKDLGREMGEIMGGGESMSISVVTSRAVAGSTDASGSGMVEGDAD